MPTMKPIPSRVTAIATVAAAVASQHPSNINELSVNKLHLMEEDKTGEALPIDIAAKDFLQRVTSVQYRDISIMANREFVPDTPSNRTRSHDDTTKPSLQKIPRFRFFIFKGTRQFNKILAMYKPHAMPVDATFETYIVNAFYMRVFKDEDEELKKLNEDEDMWHIILVGHRPLTAEEVENNFCESPWRIIAAASFKPSVRNQRSIYLSWIAVSSEKTALELWGSRRRDDTRAKLFFDGRQFNHCKALGTTMMACVQHICKMISDGRPTPKTKPNRSQAMETIYCQSSDQSLHFYKFGLGMIEMPVTDHIPGWIRDSFIESIKVLPVYLQGKILDIRQHRIMQQMIHHVQLCNPEFTAKWDVRKIKVSEFKIWNDDNIMIPKLLHILGSDGGVGHALTIYNGLIFDSNLEYAVDLTVLNLEFCNGAVYEGIVFGYKFLPKEKQLTKSKKARTKQRDRKRMQCMNNNEEDKNNCGKKRKRTGGRSKAARKRRQVNKETCLET
jgi:hypothetical protein